LLLPVTIAAKGGRKQSKVARPLLEIQMCTSELQEAIVAVRGTVAIDGGTVPVTVMVK